MKLEGVPFKNSETCEGKAFAVPGASVDLSVIEINGRYPENGWAWNREVHEMVYVKRGRGNLAVKNGEITNLNEGDVVSVTPGQKFAWSGDMTLIMACSPPFGSSQYNLEEENHHER